MNRAAPAAIKILNEGIKANPTSSLRANGVAWIYATSPQDALRNGVEAVRLAEFACKQTNNRQHEFLDTLAAAYAEVGRFPDAIAQMKTAVELASEAKAQGHVEQYLQRLKLYEQKKPFREAN